MKDREKKPLKIKFIAVVGSMMLIVSLVYVGFAGFNYYAGSIIAVAILGLAGPSVVAGDSLMGIVGGFVEMIVEGVITIVIGIAEAISSIFG